MVAMVTDGSLETTKLCSRIKSMKDPKQLQEFVDKYTNYTEHKDA